MSSSKNTWVVSAAQENPSSVILDLWSRSWQTQKGKKDHQWKLSSFKFWSKSSKSASTWFKAFLVPLDSMWNLDEMTDEFAEEQNFSGNSARLRIWSRAKSLPWALLSQMVLSFWRSDGSTVVWLPNGPLEEAIHKSKTVEKVQAICRFGPKYGLRVQQLFFQWEGGRNLGSFGLVLMENEPTILLLVQCPNQK